MPLTHGAIAKVLLAFAPASFRTNYITQTITSPQQRIHLSAELDEICTMGYAQSEGEVDEGIWGGAVPVRIGGIVNYSISIAGPSLRFDQKKRSEVRFLLTEASKQLTASVE